MGAEDTIGPSKTARQAVSESSEHGSRLTHVRDCADTCPMPLPVRTTLLALAALAAVGFAAVRITHAAEQKPVAVEQARPEREVTPAQAAATLAKLGPPPGFWQVQHCRFADRGFAEKCDPKPENLLPAETPGEQPLWRDFCLWAAASPSSRLRL